MRFILWMALALLAATPLAARAESDAIEDMVEILRKSGLIDEPTEERILRKHYRRESEEIAHAAASDVSAGPLDGLDFSGDFRLRYEMFDFRSDPTGGAADNRYRLRYRARLGFTAQLTDWAVFGFRMASGQTLTGADDPDPRSSNRTLGVRRRFDQDRLSIDWAYADFTLHESEATNTHLVAGKFANPYLWKRGRDLVVWDGDMALEGGYLQTRWMPRDGMELFANAGGYIHAEKSGNNDPKLMAIQVGGETRFSESVNAGARLTGYYWSSLDGAFMTAAGTFGNLSSAFDGKKSKIWEVNGFVGFELARVPALVYATLLQNFDASSEVIGGLRVPAEDNAWGLGLELGSPSQIAKLGGGYFHVEANSVMAQLTDSDLFDGKTNRKGWVFYASKKIASGTEISFEYFDSDYIKDSGGGTGPFTSSLGGSKRRRLRTDISFKF